MRSPTTCEAAVKKTIICCQTLVVLFFLLPGARGSGRYAEVYVANGSRYSGELLSVRDTAIVIGLVMDAQESVFMNDSTTVQVVGRSEIKLVQIEGKSYTLMGAGIGLLAGGAIGAGGYHDEGDVIGLGKAAESVTGAAVGALGGLLLGLAIGGAASSKDVEFTNQRGESMDILRPYARYQSGEPAVLKRRK
jgi:hypothetical protein